MLVGALWRRGVGAEDRSGLYSRDCSACGVHPHLAGRSPASRRRSGISVLAHARCAARWDGCNVGASLRARTVGCRGIGIVLLLVSIPFRVSAKSQQLDFSRVSYGVFDETTHDVARAILRVRAARERGRSSACSQCQPTNDPVEIEILVDGSVSETITTQRSKLANGTASIFRPVPSRRFHQIDLRIRPQDGGRVDRRPTRSKSATGR